MISTRFISNNALRISRIKVVIVLLYSFPIWLIANYYLCQKVVVFRSSKKEEGKLLRDSLSNNFGGFFDFDSQNTVETGTEKFSDEVKNNSNDFSLPWWEAGSCDAGENFVPEAITKNLNGTCGVRSSNWGPRQRVISYCFYGGNEQFKLYASGLPDILKTAQNLFPGWIIRLYTIVPHNKEQLCPLLQQFPNFHLCDIERLPGEHRNLSDIGPMLWRMAPMADDLVDIFTSRDIDAWVKSVEILWISK